MWCRMFEISLLSDAPDVAGAPVACGMEDNLLASLSVGALILLNDNAYAALNMSLFVRTRTSHVYKNLITRSREKCAFSKLRFLAALLLVFLPDSDARQVDKLSVSDSAEP